MEDANGGEAGEKKQRQEEANTEEKKRRARRKQIWNANVGCTGATEEGESRPWKKKDLFFKNILSSIFK